MSDSSSAKKSTADVGASRRHFRVLTRRSDFLRTFRLGRKIRPCDWMMFNYIAAETFRCGWTCPKAVGGAPIRNRMKRWTRDWVRKALKRDADPPKVDLNIGFRGMPDDFYRLMKRAEFDQAMERGWGLLVKRASGKAL